MLLVRSEPLNPIVQKVAGFDSNIDDCPLSVASANSITDIKYYKGEIFMMQGSMLRKITSDGKVVRLAGGGSYGYNGDGIPAVWADLN